MVNQTGFRSIPPALKIVFVLLLLWTLGSLFAISGRYTMGLPLFGIWVSGIVAALVVVVLDILGPLALAFGIWKRTTWAPTVAYVYISIFVANSLVALFTVLDQLGIMQILIPALVNLAFLGVVHWKKEYFS